MVDLVNRDWAFFDLVTGMEITLDEMAWLERELAYEAWRRTPFRWPTIREPLPPTSLLDRLAPMRSLNRPFSLPLPSAPRGWCYVREWDRSALRLMPWWLAGLIHVKHWWRWWLVALPYRWGWLEGPEGCYLHELRPRGWSAWWTPERRAGWRWVRTGERP